MARNGIVFNNAKITLAAACTKIKTAVNLSAALSKGVVSAGANLTSLRNLGVKPVLQHVQFTPVKWQPPSGPFCKVNTDGSLVDSGSTCGAIFRDKFGTYMGGFSCKLAYNTVLHAELMAIILAIEHALARGWLHIWVESDSQVAIRATKDNSIVPWDLRNRWSNCFSHHMCILFSHIFREGNCCADKLANHGHLIPGFLWWDSLPLFVRDDFLRDRFGLVNYRSI
jgi:ribonuclease HI